MYLANSFKATDGKLLQNVSYLDLLALHDLRNHLIQIILRQPQQLITQRLPALEIAALPLPIRRRQDQRLDPRIIMLDHLLQPNLRLLARSRLGNLPFLARSLLERGEDFILRDGKGGNVDVFVLRFGRVQEDGDDGFADGGEGGGGPLVVAVVGDGGGMRL